MTLTRADFNLKDLLDDVVQIIAPLAVKKGIGAGFALSFLAGGGFLRGRRASRAGVN